MSKKIVLALSLSSALMAACGGGSSGGSASPSSTPTSVAASASSVSSTTNLSSATTVSSLAASSQVVVVSSISSSLDASSSLAISSSVVTTSSSATSSSTATVISSMAASSSSIGSSSVASSVANSIASSSAGSLSISWLGTGVIPTGVELYNIDGYAALGTVTTGGGVISEDSPTYRKVTTAAEFIAAITDAKIGTKPAPVKVIEIMNDLNLGTIESGLTITGPYRAQSTQAQLHPTLKLTGLSLIDIQKIDGLTIFSQNGATIRHAEWNVKATNNLIIRNLKFDEMWEWDEATKGDYDKNDWDYITLGDGSDATKVWIDHCTFYKSYDGIVDIKGASNGVTISWSQILPGDGSNGAFIKAQMDYLEANKATMVMYNKLRTGGLTQDQITQVASTIKKGHLIGATEKNPENASLQVTLHHNYYKDLQDRMPRLRNGDVQVFNLFADSSNARAIKSWLDPIMQGNSSLVASFSGSGAYHFGITSNGTISTEDGVIEVANSLYVGVLTPLRNNQADVNDATFTGSVIAVNTQHELLATDMPVASQQSTYSALGNLWAVWKGDSNDSKSTLGPIQATPKYLSFKNAPPAAKVLHQPTQLRDVLVDGTEPAGAGKITLTVPQWLNSLNTGGAVGSSSSSSSKASSSNAASSISSAIASTSSAVNSAVSSVSTSSVIGLSSSSADVNSSSSSSSAAATQVWSTANYDLFGTSTSLPIGSLSNNTASTITLTATGGSVNTSNRKFVFASQDVTGDFVFTARLSSVTLASGTAFTVVGNNQFRFGLLVSEPLVTAASYPELGRFAELGYFTLANTPTYQASRAYKLDIGAATTQSRSNGAWALGDYLRITKAGNAITLATSPDGISFTAVNTSSFANVNGNALASTLKVGFFAAPGADALTFVFDNISLSQ